MNYSDMPYDQIARDAMSKGIHLIAVFCENRRMAEVHQRKIADAARRLGAHSVVAPRRDRRVDIDNCLVALLLADGNDGRGMNADVVYLSENARMQHEFASVMQAEVK